MARLPIQLPQRNRDKCGRLAEQLQNAFNWDDSPQGRNYWREVQRNLLGLQAFTVRPYDEDLDMPGEIVEDIHDEPNANPYDDAPDQDEPA